MTDAETLPREGWWLLLRDSTAAFFLAPRNLAGQPGYWLVRASPVLEDTWTRAEVTEAQPCEVELAVGTAHAAEWVIDPAAPAPTPVTTTLSLLVTERTCASGRPPDGRHAAPVIRESDNWVGIGWAIEPLPGGRCQSNPSVPVTVTLERPLGDRILLDLGTFPFAERS